MRRKELTPIDWMVVVLLLVGVLATVFYAATRLGVITPVRVGELTT